MKIFVSEVLREADEAEEASDPAAIVLGRRVHRAARPSTDRMRLLLPREDETPWQRTGKILALTFTTAAPTRWRCACPNNFSWAVISEEKLAEHGNAPAGRAPRPMSARTQTFARANRHARRPEHHDDPLSASRCSAFFRSRPDPPPGFRRRKRSRNFWIKHAGNTIACVWRLSSPSALAIAQIGTP